MSLLKKLKVDCHDCKFSKEKDEGYRCKNLEVEGEPFCVIYNSKGDCQLYKRKWWKITKKR